jgi:hypothetical protein
MGRYEKGEKYTLIAIIIALGVPLLNSLGKAIASSIATINLVMSLINRQGFHNHAHARGTSTWPYCRSGTLRSSQRYICFAPCRK